MRRVVSVENLYAALWKSAVTEVLAKRLGRTDPAAAIDLDHPILAGTNRYCEALARGERPRTPNSGMLRDDDPEIAAFLAQLHHRLGHARCTGDKQLQADLQRQLAEFKFGNPLWQQMSQQYFEYYAQYPGHRGGQPHYRAWNADDGGHGNPDYSIIEWRLPSDATIALIGDIGTGTDVAAAVLVAAMSFHPDAILHVGDVYYSGTRFEFAHRFVGLVESVMESIGEHAPVFTVPGNHEYFTGNLAFFECLDSGRLTCRRSQRQAASYFCLRTEDDGWQFLGMDTGYYGHYLSVSDDQQRTAIELLHQRDPNVPSDLPLQKLDPPPVDMVVLRDDEAQWHLHKIESFPGQTILLSHHPLYSAAIPCGVAQRSIEGAGGKQVRDTSDLNRIWLDTKIWRQLGRCFGERVSAWFWGHEHNLNIFQNDYRPSDWPPQVSDELPSLPIGRCIGHSAIPVQKSERPYANTYPVPLKHESLKLGLTDGWYNHGFEIIHFEGKGRRAHVRYYEVAGACPEPHLFYEEEVGGRLGIQRGSGGATRAQTAMAEQKSKPTLYSIKPSGNPSELAVQRLWTQSDTSPLPADLIHLVQFNQNGNSLLLGVSAEGKTCAFRLQDKAPWIAPVASRIDLGGSRDIVRTFSIGDRLHLIAYQADKGLLSFYAIADDLSASKPFEYYRLRQPGVTTGWTVLEPITYLNNVYYATYNFNTGAVDLFSVSVVATSSRGVPPLETENVWSWTWAKGWSRFAFFQMGGENFFLKTNTMKPNVNIDHLNNDPNTRSNEVATKMNLEDAQSLDIVRAFYQKDGAPYFLTYVKSGKTIFNRIHPDCQGWTTEARMTAATGATQIATYRIGDKSFALFY